MTRSEILDAARSIVTGEREKQYGKPEDNFATIGKLWEIYLRGRCVGGDADISINPEDVAMMMALLKIARIMTGTGTGDSFVDLAGYAACAGEIAGRNATASVQTAGDAENENMSKILRRKERRSEGEIGGLQWH